MKRQSESAKTDKAEMQATIDDLQKTLEVYEKQKPQVTNASKVLSYQQKNYSEF